MHQRYPRRRRKHGHCQVLGAAWTARAVVDFAGRSFRGGDQVGSRLEARFVAGDQPPFHGGDQRYRFEVLENVPTHVGLQVGHHGHDAVVEPSDRVAVGLSFCDLFGAEQARRAGLIYDHDLLAHIVGHLPRHNSRRNVDRARRRQWHDHLDRPDRIGGGLSVHTRTDQQPQCGK